jgi:hypothetical protein
LKVDGGAIAIDSYNNWMTAPGEKFEVLKWCDGPRIYMMRASDGGFELTISGPRTKN